MNYKDVVAKRLLILSEVFLITAHFSYALGIKYISLHQKISMESFGKNSQTLEIHMSKVRFFKHLFFVVPIMRKFPQQLSNVRDQKMGHFK